RNCPPGASLRARRGTDPPWASSRPRHGTSHTARPGPDGSPSQRIRSPRDHRSPPRLQPRWRRPARGSSTGRTPGLLPNARTESLAWETFGRPHRRGQEPRAEPMAWHSRTESLGWETFGRPLRRGQETRAEPASFAICHFAFGIFHLLFFIFYFQ